MPERDSVETQGDSTADRRQSHRKQAHLALGLNTAPGAVAGETSARWWQHDRHAFSKTPGVGRGVACTLTPAQ